MKIPVPSQRQRFTITLEVTALRPTTLGMVVYDPYRPYSDYFRRKITFRPRGFKDGPRPSREVRIPMPVSSEQLVLEVYNKKDDENEGFEVTGFSVQAMPPAELWASPERHRFMAFAIGFAQKAGYAKPGFYTAPDHEFLIQYLPVITDDAGQELVTPARIHRQMPRVQLSQRQFRQFSIPVRVAILSHEGCHYFMDTRSEREADLCGLQYYLDYGFPKIEAVYAATQVFQQHPASVGQPHLDRTSDIMAFIDRYPTLPHAS